VSTAPTDVILAIAAIAINKKGSDGVVWQLISSYWLALRVKSQETQ
jgi:hypothetical protein